VKKLQVYFYVMISFHAYLLGPLLALQVRLNKLAYKNGFLSVLTRGWIAFETQIAGQTHSKYQAHLSFSQQSVNNPILILFY
jgi:hypothetical protein